MVTHMIQLRASMRADAEAFEMTFDPGSNTLGKGFGAESLKVPISTLFMLLPLNQCSSKL